MRVCLGAVEGVLLPSTPPRWALAKRRGVAMDTAAQPVPVTPPSSRLPRPRRRRRLMNSVRTVLIFKV